MQSWLPPHAALIEGPHEPPPSGSTAPRSQVSHESPSAAPPASPSDEQSLFWHSDWQVPTLPTGGPHRHEARAEVKTVAPDWWRRAQHVSHEF
jgi:hypothetical protein